MNLTNLLALGGGSAYEEAEDNQEGGKRTKTGEEGRGGDSGYSSWRRVGDAAGDARRRAAGVGGAEEEEEKEWYDDQGFLIEASADLSLPLSRGSTAEGGSADYAVYTPRLKERFPAFISASHTSPPANKPSDTHHYETARHAHRLPPPHVLPLQPLHVPLPPGRHMHPSLSQLSFDPRIVEIAVVSCRDVIDAEKRRKQRQHLLGLETSDLALDQEEVRRVLQGGRGFVHAPGQTTARLQENRGRKACVSKAGVRGGCGRGRGQVGSVHSPDWAPHALTLQRAQIVRTSAPPRGEDCEELGYLAGRRHPLASTFGTAYERTAAARIDGLVHAYDADGNVPVGYCAQCSAVHVGRRAGALDSVVEGLRGDGVGWRDDDVSRSGEGRGRVDEFGVGQEETVTFDERRGDREGWRRWCWPFRRGSCVSAAAAGASEEKDEGREDERARLWSWSHKGKRGRFCERLLGRTSVAE